MSSVANQYDHVRSAKNSVEQSSIETTCRYQIEPALSQAQALKLISNVYEAKRCKDPLRAEMELESAMTHILHFNKNGYQSCQVILSQRRQLRLEPDGNKEYYYTIRMSIDDSHLSDHPLPVFDTPPFLKTNYQFNDSKTSSSTVRRASPQSPWTTADIQFFEELEITSYSTKDENLITDKLNSQSASNLVNQEE